MYTQDAYQQALTFLVAQTTFIEPTVVRIKYPELNYKEFVPIENAGDEWAKSITFFSLDVVGQANWFHAEARDIPNADAILAKHEQGIEMAGIGYHYNLEELAMAMKVPNLNLTNEKAMAARRAYEEFCHNVAMYGDSRKAWYGLTNHVAPPIINVTHTWNYYMAQTTPQPQNILQDINAILTGVWQSSLTVEMANTVLLPLQAMALLAMVQLPQTTMNLLSWLMQNNIYTQETGGQLLIRGVRGLDTASATGSGRAIVYRRDPTVLKMHVPMPHKFLPALQTGPIRFDVPGIFRLGGLEVRLPGAIRYVDGIS